MCLSYINELNFSDVQPNAIVMLFNVKYALVSIMIYYKTYFCIQ
jgi:hypothetical protein